MVQAGGTPTLLAALKVASGEVLAQVRQRRTSVNFLQFMDTVVSACPDCDLHVIVDNLNIHKNQAAQGWLARHPRVHFYYTPTHASWVNLIECFFSILTRQGLQQSVHRFETGTEGIPATVHRPLQSVRLSIRLDQRSAAFTEDHPGHPGVSSRPPATAQAVPGQRA